MRKNPAQEKKSRKYQKHCVQNSIFQGFYKHKKNPKNNSKKSRNSSKSGQHGTIYL